MVPPYVPAAPFTMAMLRVAAVEAASAHVVLLVSVIVTTLSLLASAPVAVQDDTKVDGVSSVTVGAVELVVKPEGKVTVIVRPVASAPDDDVVNPTVHVEAVLATRDVGAVPVNVTVERDEALALTTLESVISASAINATLFAVRTSLEVTIERPLTRPGISRWRRGRGCGATRRHDTGQRRHGEIGRLAGGGCSGRHGSVIGQGHRET